MFRISLIVVLTSLLVGCSSAPAQTTEPAPTVSMDTTQKPTTAPTEAPTKLMEATTPAEAMPPAIQEYPVPPRHSPT